MEFTRQKFEIIAQANVLEQWEYRHLVYLWVFPLSLNESTGFKYKN